MNRTTKCLISWAKKYDLLVSFIDFPLKNERIHLLVQILYIDNEYSTTNPSQTIKINSQFVKTIVTMMENKNESKNGGDG